MNAITVLNETFMETVSKYFKCKKETQTNYFHKNIMDSSVISLWKNGLYVRVLQNDKLFFVNLYQSWQQPITTLFLHVMSEALKALFHSEMNYHIPNSKKPVLYTNLHRADILE